MGTFFGLPISKLEDDPNVPFRLNIYYLLLEKMSSFASESKFDVSNVPGAQIAGDYESKRSDAWSVIENLGIIKRIISVCKFLHYFSDYPPFNQISI